MDYALIKELKGAGFPFIQVDPKNCTERMIYTKGGEFHLEPTLSELIEACGDKFGRLEAIVENAPVDEVVTYVVNDHYSFKGSTPEIAMAKLYLAIHSQELKDSKDMID